MYNVGTTVTKYNITAIISDKKGRVLSVGQNSYVKSHPIQAKYAKRVGRDDCVFLHAEIAAIIKCKNLDDAYKIFVSRLSDDGQTKLAKPCDICMSAISATNIKIIQYT